MDQVAPSSLEVSAVVGARSGPGGADSVTRHSIIAATSSARRWLGGSTFGPLLEAEHHLALHHEVQRLPHRVVDRGPDGPEQPESDRHRQTDPSGYASRTSSRVLPPASRSSTKAHVPMTRARFGSRTVTGEPIRKSGPIEPVSIRSPTFRSCSSGWMRGGGMPALDVVHRPGCPLEPVIAVEPGAAIADLHSHGQIASGGASIVTARV